MQFAWPCSVCSNSQNIFFHMEHVIAVSEMVFHEWNLGMSLWRWQCLQEVGTTCRLQHHLLGRKDWEHDRTSRGKLEKQKVLQWCTQQLEGEAGPIKNKLFFMLSAMTVAMCSGTWIAATSGSLYTHLSRIHDFEHGMESKLCAGMQSLRERSTCSEAIGEHTGKWLTTQAD